MKIGFFGGCFNPPTIAHFEIVNVALKTFKFDKLIIIPMGDKYEKKDLISFKDRVEMLKLLFNNNSKVEISKMQENQSQRFFAIDSFNIIDKKYKNDERFFIMGMDNFSKINTWKNTEELLDNRNYIVFKRFDIVPQIISSNIQYIDFNQKASSSIARELIINGESTKDILTPSIIDYINQNGLYRKGEKV